MDSFIDITNISWSELYDDDELSDEKSNDKSMM
jgi:hypothetical protein